ncbi:MAG: SEC-C domain-containing protein [Actinobacteria bacterium]|nr:SEC-C domain-containing protein [Actinomycetota bacterium]
MPGSPDDLASAVRQLLTERGPLAQQDVFDALISAGIDLGPDPDESLMDALELDPGPVLQLADDRWAWIPAVLDGRVFTHRLSGAEAEHDAIVWDSDLAPLSMLTEIPQYQQLCDGAPISEVFEDLDDDVLAERGVPRGLDSGEGLLLLPRGRFVDIGVGAGDLVGLRVTADGFELSRVAATADCDLGAALTGILGQRPQQPVMVDAAVWTACAGSDDLFWEPTLPLTELLAASGLARDRDALAPAGFDFDGWRAGLRIRRLAANHGLDEDEARAVLTVTRLCGYCLDLVTLADQNGQVDPVEVAGLAARFAAPPDDQERMPVLTAVEFLADPLVTAAVYDETASAGPLEAAALGLFAETVEPMAPRAARPALRWMRGKAHELCGDIHSAEAVFESGESLDASWPLTLMSLARYAADRGDAERALSMLRRAGASEDHEMIQMLLKYRPAARIGLGRNDRCWCGSGRKYKVCHLNREQLPLEERAAWLYRKAGSDLAEGEFAALHLECAQARAVYSTDPDALERALYDDPFPADVVLFEGGAFEEFLRLRGHLLPDDERLLAEQWLLTDRSLHEVLEVHPGAGMTMRDVRTGDVHQVRERSASRLVKSGEFYCGRIVPAGETMQIFGGMEPVALGQHEDVLALLDEDPEPVDLVDYLSRWLAPPRMANTEGEPLLLCDATLAVTDPDALTRELDATYDRLDDDADGTRAWVEHVLTDGMQRIRAQLELRGDQLLVHANSAPRFERVLSVVGTLDPSATVVSETREPAGSVEDIARLSAKHPAPAAVPDPESPELAAVLEQVTRQYEQAWLDQPIPALSGRTPRECAADPTRRPDLIRLLDSFPDIDAPGAMSPARLRAALELTD